MATDGQSDLVGFHQFVGEHLANADVELSLEQALAMWRQRQVENEAIREGLRAVDEGRTRPVDEFIADVELRHGLREQA